MRNRIEPWFFVVIALAVIGIADSFSSGAMGTLIIPLTLVAIIFLLYKFPPNRLRKPRSRGNRPTNNRGIKEPYRLNPKQAANKRRPSPFTVIDGRKNKEDDPPKYH
ncbi:hypothetical protein [Cohnella yongneupensis]|uniref:Uncharacterized protein n=1 Tax=Cohnella yongneupensis TaxID=425006 RepID=A0ABW0R8G3_9BACL